MCMSGWILVFVAVGAGMLGFAAYVVGESNVEQEAVAETPPEPPPEPPRLQPESFAECVNGAVESFEERYAYGGHNVHYYGYVLQAQTAVCEREFPP